MLALGVQPTRAEVAYGYIQKGEPSGIADIFKVKAVTEKPDMEFAKMFVESDEWVCISVMFVLSSRI